MSAQTGLSTRAAIGLVARREFVTRGRERGFLISTLITLAVVIGIIVISQATKGSSYDVGVSGPRAAALEAAMKSAPKSGDTKVSVTTYDSAEAARSGVRDGSVDAAIGADGRVYVKTDLNSTLGPIINSAYAAVVSSQRLQQQGIDPGKVASALDVKPLAVHALLGGQEDRSAKKAIAYIGVILLYGQLIAFGMIVAMGVVEEKSSRVVELLLSTIRPWQLLTGKILGIGALGLIQLALIAIAGLITGSMTDAISLQGDVVGTILSVVGWFILGYAFYSCAFAAAASLVSRQEELQNVTTPLTIILLASFFISFKAISDPTGQLARILSIIPPVSTMVMPPRIAGSSVPAGQIVLAIVLMLAAIGILIRVGGRIYGSAVLRSGPRISWREALRSNQEKASAG
jgi:ABC-2 type transport system permease protein